MNYTGWLQLVLSYDETSCMKICVEPDFAYAEDAALNILAEHYPEIKECLIDKTGKVLIVKQEKNLFELSTGGGKVRSVIDFRKKG